MSYDMWALGCFMAFCTMRIVWCVTSCVYLYAAQYQIVRRSVLYAYERDIKRLQKEVALLKRGGINYKKDKRTGQFGFDFALAEQPRTITRSYEIGDKQVDEVWAAADWVNYSQGKQFVNRHKRKLWVNEQLPTDIPADLPFKRYEYTNSSLQ
jgi:hypothetical protein